MIVTALAFIVVLGITITIHEFGHFAMAKLLKIRVLIFSLGFGPRLTGFERGGTDYRLSPIPLGGYVKMAGEAFDEERSGSAEEFLSHPKWHRLLVALAGPFMNIVLAVAILTFSYMGGVYVPQYLKQPPVVGPVATNSLAHHAGLMTGDTILSVRGNEVRTWEDMEIALATTPKNDLDVVVLRGSEQHHLHFEAPEAAQIDAGSLGYKFSIPRTVVAAVSPRTPAQAAGLQEGDEILSVAGNGRTGRNYNEILNIVSASKGIPLTFEIRRSTGERPGESAGKLPGGPGAPTQTLQLTIAPFEDGGRVMIGFSPEIPTDLEKFGLGSAVIQSIHRNYEMSALTFRIIGRIFRGSASVKTISGPLEIARISGSAARSGSLRIFIGFLGMISLQLGVFNLLPIPVLDGGVIAMLLFEGLIRRDLNIRLKERIMQAGIVFLILLMGIVVFNDLSKMLGF